MSPAVRHAAPAPLAAVLAVTFLGSVSGGAFWSGIFFVTARHYQFSPTRNLLLAAAMGVVYALAAGSAGRLLRALERRVMARTVVAASLAVEGLVSIAPLTAPASEAVLWATALAGAAASATLWPVVESYLTAGRHGAEMRRAIGHFNVTWTAAMAVPLLVMPIVARAHELLTLAIPAVANGAALVAVLRLPLRPAPHDPEEAHVALGPEYVWLKRCASWLLPLSYVLSSTIAPVLPHRLTAVGVPGAAQSLVASIWMGTRFGTLAVMARLRIWHGRWGTLALGAGTMVLGLAGVLLGGSLGTIAAGLGLFGTGMGIVYYAALYYSMAVGHGAVDAGGSFELLIGLGYVVGPLVGLAGEAVAGPAQSGRGTVALTWALLALAAGPTLRPYLAARRRRR